MSAPAKYVTTKVIPITSLDHFPGNANKGDPEKILESLKANGQYRSLIVRHVDRRNVVMAGNHTLKALRLHGPGTCSYDSEQTPCGICHHGWDERVRCEVYTCDDQRAIKINIADNRIPEFSERDEDMIAAQLRELDDLLGSGYSQSDFDALGNVPLDEIMPEPGDALIEDMPTAFGVVVECSTEEDQTALLERLSSEGYSVRAMISG
jgi:ParB-like chromosome segregation protein Spo0J